MLAAGFTGAADVWKHDFTIITPAVQRWQIRLGNTNRSWALMVEVVRAARKLCRLL